MYVAWYIDDNLIVGDIEAIDGAISAIKNNKLVLKVVKGLEDYLSQDIKFSKNKKRALLGLLHLIKNMEKKFGKCVQDVPSHKTPGTHKFLIIRPMVDNEKISAKDQQEYGQV